MAVTAHVFPVATQTIASKGEKWTATADTLRVLLVASGTFNWPGTTNSTAAYTTVAQFLANAGTGGGGALTEVANGSGYTTNGLALTGVGFSTTGLVNDLTASGAIQWSAATFTAKYALFYDAFVDTDNTTRVPLVVWDFGGAQSCSSGTFTLTLGTSAGGVANSLIEYTNS